MKKRNNDRHTVVIGGYYGYGNIGDEAVLFSLLSGIAKKLPNSRIFVLSKDSFSLPHVGGIDVIAKDRHDPLAVLSAFLKADLYISGGGSLFQDRTSSKSLSYYCALIHLAKLCGCKVFVFANGIGPLKNEKKCKSALCIADFVSVRDKDSFEFAKRLMKKKGEPTLSADPVFAHHFDRNRAAAFAFGDSLWKKPYFAVSLRTLADGRCADTKALEEGFLRLRSEGFTPVFVSMQDSFDLEISQIMAERTGGIVAGIKNEDELFFVLEKASFAVGMRLHFLLTAAMAGTPSVALSYDCKVESCMRDLCASQIICDISPSAHELVEAVHKAKREFSRAATDEMCRAARARALRDIDIAASLLENSGERVSEGEKFFADT